MTLPRRHFLHQLACAVSLPTVSRFAWAQAYPSRPVRILVPAAAGGGQDLSARLMGQWLSERLGQQFVVENRPGAGGNIATETLIKSPPDGYTLYLAGGASAISAALYEKLTFNFSRDTAPIAGLVSGPFVIMVARRCQWRPSNSESLSPNKPKNGPK